MEETTIEHVEAELAALPPDDVLLEEDVSPGVVAISGARLGLTVMWGTEWAVDQGWLMSALNMFYGMSNSDVLNAVAAAGGLQPFMAAMEGGEDYSNGGRLYKVYDGVAHIPLSGLMTKRPTCMQAMFGSGASTMQFRYAHRSANRDPSVQSKLNVIDSPGGDVSGSFDASNDVMNGKPSDTFFEDMGASAALLAGIGARHVSANINAVLGSVGVYTKLTESKQAEGRRVYVVKAGKYKAIGEEGQDITAEHLASVQRRVDEIHNLFLRQITKTRAVTKAQLASIADADVYIGHQAVKVGLVDSIGDIDAAHRAAVKANKEQRRKVMPVPDAQLSAMLNPGTQQAEQSAAAMAAVSTPEQQNSLAVYTQFVATLSAAGVNDLAQLNALVADAQVGRAAVTAAREKAGQLAVAVYGLDTPESQASVDAAKAFINGAPYPLVQATITSYEAQLRLSGNAAPAGAQQAQRLTSPQHVDAAAVDAFGAGGADYAQKTYSLPRGGRNGGS